MNAALALLYGMLDQPAPVPARESVPLPVSQAMDAFMRASAHEFVPGACPHLAALLRQAQREGRDIMMIGCAPSDVVAPGDGSWSARVTIVLEGSRDRLHVRLEGHDGRIASAVMFHTTRMAKAA